jgi:hypothetical protein
MCLDILKIIILQFSVPHVHYRLIYYGHIFCCKANDTARSTLCTQ